MAVHCISNYDANYTYTFDPIGPVVDGGGNYNKFRIRTGCIRLTATNALMACESAVSQSAFMIEEMLPTPDAPTLTVTPATCNVDGSALISNYDPLYTYTFVPAGPSVDGSWQHHKFHIRTGLYGNSDECRWL
jgi:hypothetical protein